jgi:hypothetical protein
MKRIFFSLLFLVTCFFVKAQQSVDPRIQEVYGDKTQELAINDPERISVLMDLLNNRVQVMESPLNPGDKFPKLSSIGLLNKYNPAMTRDAVFNPKTFNPLKYHFSFFPKTEAVYRVDNTDYIIVIKPQSLNK